MDLTNNYIKKFSVEPGNENTHVTASWGKQFKFHALFVILYLKFLPLSQVV